MEAVIVVVVLHDAALVRSALEHVLGQEHDIEITATGSVTEAVRVVRDTGPHVVVCAARRTVHAEVLQVLGDAGARLIVQVRADDPRVLADVLLSGACGLFSDRTGGAELVEAVRHVASGSGWLAPDLVPVLLSDYLPYHRRRVEARARLRDLDQGEVRLLALVARGWSNTEIAGELHLAVSTVKDYVGSMLGRLGATRSEAIVVGVRAALPVSGREDRPLG